ncbi:MAG: hypothetical protein AB1420_00650 [Bacillota bacterium]
MIVVAITNWRKKLILLICVILLAIALSLSISYYRSANVSGEMEDIFKDIVDSEQKAATMEPDTNPLELNNQENGVEQPFTEGENQFNGNESQLEKKGFWEKIKEKFKR